MSANKEDHSGLLGASKASFTKPDCFRTRVFAGGHIFDPLFHTSIMAKPIIRACKSALIFAEPTKMRALVVKIAG
jgi:hypothetical protein